MIVVTRLDGSTLMLNDDQIVFVEVLHDTVITLANGDMLRVQESAEEVARRVARWRRRLLGLSLLSLDEVEEGGPE